MADRLVHLHLDLDGPPEGLLSGFLDKPKMVVLQALSHELTGNGEGEHLLAQTDRAHVREPHQERGLRQLGSRSVQDDRPCPSSFLIG